MMNGTFGYLDRMLAKTALALIRGYQLTISPALSLLFPGGGCRFHPSCSRYASECLRSHAFPRALWLIVKRVGKCHPFHPGGVDPVPGACDGKAKRS